MAAYLHLIDEDVLVLYYGTMPRRDATLDQIRRLNGGLHWDKVEKLLKRLGAEVYEGSGSSFSTDAS